MTDVVLDLAVVCFILSSLRLGGNKLLEEKSNLARIFDNIALLGKIIASLIALAVIAISANALFLYPLTFYVLSARLYYVKTKRKGTLWVFNKPYEMKVWDRETINESSVGVLSAVFTSLANISILTFSILIYNGTI